MKIFPLINSGDRNDRRPRTSDPVQPKKDPITDESLNKTHSQPEPLLQERVGALARNLLNQS